MNANRQRATRLRVARWLVAVTIFGSTMAIGGIHAVVLVSATALLLAAVGLAWWGAEPLRARRCASLVLVAGALLTLSTALSVVPLPMGLLTRLSPHGADIWARCLLPLARPGPAWATLSLDPGATAIEL